MTETPTGERLAKLEVQVEGIREQQKAHHTELKVFCEKLAAKVDDLTGLMNKGRGAYAFALLIAAVVGGFVMDAMGSLFHKGTP